jgi:hypothetical protein
LKVAEVPEHIWDAEQIEKITYIDRNIFDLAWG